MYAEEDASVDLMKTRLWMMHRFCISCKLSGAVFAATEVEDAIPIIHGPVGCAFNHRIPVMKSFLKVKAMPCTDLDENDTVFGGLDKLRSTIIEVNGKYQPKLIIVLLSCVSGIIGDDVEGIITELKEEKKTKAEVIWADTSGFKFRDPRERTETMIREGIYNYENPDDYKPRSEEGCGQVELLNSFATQLMEDPEKCGGVIENGVNLMGTKWWGFDRTQEQIDILTEAGAKINSIFFFNTTTEKIKQASRARLNIVHRFGEWIEIMKERFGTDVVYDGFFEFSSLPYQERIRNLYYQAGEKLGIEKKMEKVVDKRLQILNNKLKPYRDFLKDKRVLIFRAGNNIYGFDTPMAMMVDLGLSIEAISMDYDYLFDRSVPPEARQQHRRVALDIFNKLGIQADIIEETPFGKEEEIIREYKPDLVFTTQERKPKIQSLGVPAYSRHTFRFSSSMGGLLEVAKEIHAELKRENLTKKKPIIFREIDYDSTCYPYIRKVSAPIFIADELRYAVPARVKESQNRR